MTEEVGRQLFKLVGHAGGSLAMIGLRLVMFVLGLEGAVRSTWPTWTSSGL